MLTENQEKWLQALESGDYEQGQNYLVKDSKYCCLGVACEIFEAMYVTRNTPESSYRVYSSGSFLPPEDVVEKLGLRDNKGSDHHGSFGHTLVGLNDSGKTFKEIVKIVRSNPEGYFK